MPWAAMTILKEMYTKAYEGHVRQYSAAKTVDVPIGRLGMYYKEFPSQFDWQHNGEGLTVFNLMPLGDPYSHLYRERVKRFAGFYMDEDPGAPNYDPKLKLIKSLMNGSRGPMLRKATALDWTGDPIEVENRFPSLGHGEGAYKGMLAHFEGYTDVVGDHPLNLAATQLATNAYMLTHEKKYKDWVLGYCDAWAQRARDNGGIIPSNIGLDGKIGGATDGKWYGGAYGWGFSPIVPMTGKPADRNRVPWCINGFMNAYLLSRGDDKYLDVWRKTADKFDAAAKTVDGKLSSPHHVRRPGLLQLQARQVPAELPGNLCPVDEAVRPRPLRGHRMVRLSGRQESRLSGQGAARGPGAHPPAAWRPWTADSTSPDMRLADSALEYNPASITALTQLMEGGLYLQHGSWARTSPNQGGTLLFTPLALFRSGAPARRPAAGCGGAGGQLGPGQPHASPWSISAPARRAASSSRAAPMASTRSSRCRDGTETTPVDGDQLPGPAGAGCRCEADHQDEALRQRSHPVLPLGKHRGGPWQPPRYRRSMRRQETAALR